MGFFCSNPNLDSSNIWYILSDYTKIPVFVYINSRKRACPNLWLSSTEQQMQPKRPQQAAEARHRAEPEQDKTLSSSVVRKRVPKNPVVIKSRVSPTDTKAKNTGGCFCRDGCTELKWVTKQSERSWVCCVFPADSNLNIIDDIVELSSFRALSPASSNGRASHSSQVGLWTCDVVWRYYK